MMALLSAASRVETSALYREIVVSNGGSIQGKVLWKSRPPVPQVMPVAKDQNICGDSKVNPCMVVGKNGEVPNAVVFLDGITAGKKRTPPLKVQLDQKNCEYVPHVLIVAPETEVELLNSDPTLHNVHTYSMNGERPATIFNLAFPLKGQKVTKKISESGTILSLCDAGHPWMSAHLFVTHHPYYAVTGENGDFKLEDVPPGKYTLKLWHAGMPKLEANSNTGFLKTPASETSKQVSVSSKQKVTVNFEL